MTRNRLYAAFTCYAVLAIVALLALEGPFRLMTWIVLAGLGAKTYIAYLRER